jgi:hypothetical protein
VTALASGRLCLEKQIRQIAKAKVRFAHVFRQAGRAHVGLSKAKCRISSGPLRFLSSDNEPAYPTRLVQIKATVRAIITAAVVHAIQFCQGLFLNVPIIRGRLMSNSM